MAIATVPDILSRFSAGQHDVVEQRLALAQANDAELSALERALLCQRVDDEGGVGVAGLERVPRRLARARYSEVMVPPMTGVLCCST